MATLMVASVGLLFSTPGSAAEARPATAAAKPAAEARDPMIQRGEYLVKIGGCNDRFISDLGPKGERAPVAAAPGVVVNTPVIVFEPRIETTASNAGAAKH